MSGATPLTSSHDSEPPKHGAIGHLSTEEELQQKVCAALIDAKDLDSSNVGVRVSNGAVILSGSVTSQDALVLAVKLARSQAGVTDVQSDELRVGG
jgi:osmotically-inducible protein OsmY